MKILILGDVMGLSGRKALKKTFQKLYQKMILVFQLSTVKMLLMMEKVLPKK